MGDRENAPFTLQAMMLSGSLAISSCYDIVSSKEVSMTLSKDIDGNMTKFNHPFVQALISLVSLSLLFFPYLILSRFSANSHSHSHRRLPDDDIEADSIKREYNNNNNNDDDEDEEDISIFAPSTVVTTGRREIPAKLVFVPSVAMVMAVILTVCSIEVIPVSLIDMMKGFGIIVCVLIAGILLHRSYFRYHYLSLVVLLSGVLMVSITYLLTAQTHGVLSPSLGVVLVLGAQVAMAIRLVWYEDMLHRYPNASILRTLGIEGFFTLPSIGLFILIFSFLPGHQPGNQYIHFENAWTQIKNNSLIFTLLSIDVFVLPFAHWSSIALVKCMTSVHESVLSQWCSVLAWLTMMALSTEQFSAVRLIGFILILLGSFFFVRLISLISLFPSLYPAQVLPPKSERVDAHAHDSADDDESESSSSSSPAAATTAATASSATGVRHRDHDREHEDDDTAPLIH